VFFPVVYVPGIAGAFFRDQALTVTFSLLVSVVAALLLQPVLASRMLRIPDNRDGAIRKLELLLDPLFRAFARGFDAFHDAYHSLLIWALARRVPMLVILVAFLGASFWFGTSIPRSFMPERSSGDMRLDFELPAGTPLEETIEISEQLARWIDADEAVKDVFTQVGSTERNLATLQDFTAPNTSRMRILLKPQRGAYKQGLRLESEIAEYLTRFDEIEYAFREEGIGLGEILSSGGAGFTLGIVAEEPEVAVRLAEELVSHLQQVDGLEELRVDRVLGNPNVVVQLNREEILRSGLDPEVMATEMRNRIAGVEATTFNEVEQRIDISVRFDRQTRLDFERALRSPIRVADGQSVPLSSFLIITEEQPVRELVRKDQRRMVTVSGDVRGRSLDDVWEDALQVATEVQGDANVSFVQGGERADRNRSFQDLGWAMVLAIVLVYMILAAQFESFLDPLLIAAVLPIGVAGALLAIGITGNSINILSLIGAVALLGIAVNDAIVKVDTIRRLREDGVPGREAILQASSMRLRPIIMTSVTTVLAMLPMAIGLGSGEQLQRPLAVTIIGGLTLTTALTLIYTPILFGLAHHIGPEDR
jgi:HAE1 family hydrophobic/amphiphilic exporter-1